VNQSDLRDAICRVLAGGRTLARKAPEALARHTPPKNHSGMRILLAEDNAVNQKVALRLLEREGHSVVVVGDGKQALMKFEEEPFDIILMDVQMPNMDGFEATAAIRRREKEIGGAIPILAVTAHAMKGDQERCLAAGMNGYITKPIRPNDLNEAIESLTSWSGPPAGVLADVTSL
jgi:CheY-like chemotaxis protein